MTNMTTTQAETLEQLRAAGLARHTWANVLGVASFARGDFGSMGSGAQRRHSNVSGELRLAVWPA